MDAYQRIKKVGEGAFGKALLVRRKADDTPLVIKEVDLSKMKTKERRDAKKELAVLRDMKHPNIISYIDGFEEGSKLYMVMEYAR